MIDETVPPERVAIVGAGVIGAAWAARWLLRGVDVAVSDPSSDAPRIVSQVLDNARRAWTRMGTAPKHEGKLDFSDSIEAAVLDADLVQESVPENLEIKKATKRIYDIINYKSYKFIKRAKENNELYGSIKPKEICQTIESINKIEIKPSQIDLGKEINKIGSYEAKINLHAEIQAKIHIVVVKEEDKS